MEATQTISLSDLTPTQLKELHAQLKAQRKQSSGNRKEWQKTVDSMLQEREGDGFKHTTATILDTLISKNLVPASAERKAEIKKIQTRKQLLEKKLDKDGKPLFSVGYKPSATAFGPMSVEKVLTWILTASKDDIARIASVVAPAAKTPSKGKGK